MHLYNRFYSTEAVTSDHRRKAAESSFIHPPENISKRSIFKLSAAFFFSQAENILKKNINKNGIMLIVLKLLPEQGRFMVAVPVCSEFRCSPFAC